MSNSIRSTVLKLNNGLTIPILGLGTLRSNAGEVKMAVEVAIDAGYRHIDGAGFCQTEAEVGQGLKPKLNEVKLKYSQPSHIDTAKIRG